MDIGREKELFDKAYRLGFDYEKRFGGCAQTTFAAIQDALGMRNDAVFKATTGLAAGGGATGLGTCGGYLAGVMAISLICGRERGNFDDPGRHARMQSFDLSKKLTDAYLKEFGSLHCRDIQTALFGRPYYIYDAVEFEKFEAAGGHEDKCTSVVGRAARMAVQVIVAEGLLDRLPQLEDTW